MLTDTYKNDRTLKETRLIDNHNKNKGAVSIRYQIKY